MRASVFLENFNTFTLQLNLYFRHWIHEPLNHEHRNREHRDHDYGNTFLIKMLILFQELGTALVRT